MEHAKAVGQCCRTSSRISNAAQTLMKCDVSCVSVRNSMRSSSPTTRIELRRGSRPTSRGKTKRKTWIEGDVGYTSFIGSTRGTSTTSYIVTYAPEPNVGQWREHNPGAHRAITPKNVPLWERKDFLCEHCP